MSDPAGSLLLGINERALLYIYGRIAEKANFRPIGRAAHLHTMIYLFRERQYDVVLMDVNLEESGSESIGPALRFYGEFRDKISSGEVRFGVRSSRDYLLDRFKSETSEKVYGVNSGGNNLGDFRKLLGIG